MNSRTHIREKLSARTVLQQCAIALGLLLAARVSASYGFVCEVPQGGGPCLHWQSGGATLHSFLLPFPLPGPLLNGTLGWDQNSINAANDWNAAGAAFRFSVEVVSSINDPCAPQGLPAGDNPIFFAPSTCGSGFGDIVAQAVLTWNIGSGTIVSAPVFVNSTVPWNAYDGPIRPPINDLRRVLLHEFGHVLGLDHNDSVAAIMNGRESDIDRLQTDDVNGIHSLYPSSGGASGSGCQLVPRASLHAGWGLWLVAAVALTLRRAARR